MCRRWCVAFGQVSRAGDRPEEEYSSVRVRLLRWERGLLSGRMQRGLYFLVIQGLSRRRGHLQENKISKMERAMEGVLMNTPSQIGPSWDSSVLSFIRKERKYWARVLGFIDFMILKSIQCYDWWTETQKYFYFVLLVTIIWLQFNHLSYRKDKSFQRNAPFVFHD